MPGTHQIYGIKALQRNLFLKQLINIYPTAGWSLLLFDTPYFLFTTTSDLKRKLKYINWGFYEAQNDSCIVIYSVRSKAGWELGRTTEKQYVRTEVVQENLNRSSACLYSPVITNRDQGFGGALLSPGIHPEVGTRAHSPETLREGTEMGSKEADPLTQHWLHIDPLTALTQPHLIHRHSTEVETTHDQPTWESRQKMVCLRACFA